MGEGVTLRILSVRVWGVWFRVLLAANAAIVKIWLDPSEERARSVANGNFLPSSLGRCQRVMMKVPLCAWGKDGEKRVFRGTGKKGRRSSGV